MSYKELRRKVETLQAQLTPAFLEDWVTTFIRREGEDVGGGVNMHRLVKHLLETPGLRDVEAVWAYDRLKPAFREALRHQHAGQIPSLYYFEGD